MDPEDQVVVLRPGSLLRGGGLVPTCALGGIDFAGGRPAVGGVVYLQRSPDLAVVVRMPSGGHERIDRLEGFVQFRGRRIASRIIPALATAGRRREENLQYRVLLGQAVGDIWQLELIRAIAVVGVMREQQGLDVVVGAADEDGDASASSDLVDRHLGLADEASDLPDLARRVQDAEEVVRHPLALRGRDLVRDDRQSPVQLHRVRVDDFAVQRKRQFYG